MDGRALLVAFVVVLLLAQQATALVLTDGHQPSQISGELSTELSRNTVTQTATPRPLDAPPVVRWTKTYGGPQNERAFAAVRLGDGYAFGGSTNSIDNVSGRPTDMWVVHVDADGNRVWSRTIGTSGSEAVRDLVATEDGGLLVVGELGAGQGTRIITLDADGTIESSWLFGPNRLARAAIGVDGEYVIVGSVTEGEGFARPGAVAFVVSEDDYRIDTHTGRSIATETFTAVTQTANGDIVAVGQSDRGEGDTDGWAVRLTPDGNVSWNRLIPEPSGDVRPAAVVELPDGDLLVAGVQNRGNVDDGWLVRLDGQTGTVEWRETFDRLGFTDVVTNGRGALVVGADFTNRVSRDAVVLSVDGQGRERWRQTYGGPENDVFTSLVPTDTGYLLVGWSDTGASKAEEFFVVAVERAVTVESMRVSPQQVAPGESVTVTATLVNRGDERQRYETTVFVDGESRETQSRMVAVGNETTVTFNLSFDTAGTYRVGVDEATPVTVEVSETGEPTTSAEPTTGVEPTAEPTPEPTPPTETTSPGLGGVVAVTALLVVALAFAMRTRLLARK